jgi:hypothetical protein
MVVVVFVDNLSFANEVAPWQTVLHFGVSEWNPVWSLLPLIA